MTGFLRDLAERALGVGAIVSPRVAMTFVPEHEAPLPPGASGVTGPRAESAAIETEKADDLRSPVVLGRDADSRSARPSRPAPAAARPAAIEAEPALDMPPGREDHETPPPPVSQRRPRSAPAEELEAGTPIPPDGETAPVRRPGRSLAAHGDQEDAAERGEDSPSPSRRAAPADRRRAEPEEGRPDLESDPPPRPRSTAAEALPVSPPLPATAPSRDAGEPDVHVHVGRIEVRAAESAPPPRPPAPREPSLSLEEYLERPGGSGR